MELPTESKSWFIPTEKDNHKKCYHYEDFCNQLNIQLQRKLGIDEKNKKCERLNESYYFQELKISIEEHQFNNLFEDNSKNNSNNNSNNNNNNNSKEHLFPFLTFHSTQDITKINVITKYGYLLPGETHSVFGYTLGMRTGNIYGDGIYSSPNFETSHWYSFLDKNRSVQLIVNLIFPGCYKRVKNCNWFIDEKNKNNPDNNFVIPSHYSDRYIDVIDNKEYTSLTSENLDIWVVGDKARIIPVAVITLTPHITAPDLRNYIYFPKRSEFGSLLPYEYHEDKKYLSVAYHIVDDWYMISARDVKPREDIPNNNISSPNNDKKIENPYLCISSTEDMNLDNIFCVPSNILNNSHFVKAMDTFLNQLNNNDRSVTFYGPHNNKIQSIYYKKVSKIGEFHSHVDNFQNQVNLNKSIKQESNNKEMFITPYLESIFHHITKKDYQLIDKVITIIYLFVTTVTDIKDIRELVERNLNYLKVRKIIIKLIFLDKVINELLYIKSSIQNIHYYESFFHYCQLSKCSDLFDILTDELSNINLFSKYTSINMPYPLGVIGEGFINSFEEINPSWDIKSSHDFILYKGQAPKYLKISDKYFKCFIYHDRKHNSTNEIIDIEATYSVDSMITYVFDMIIPIFSRFRNYVFAYPNRCKSHCQHIWYLLEQLIKILSYNTNNEDLIVGVTYRRTVKYKLQSLFSDLITFSSVKLKGKYFSSLMSMKFNKSILKRVHSEFRIDEVIVPYGIKIRDPADALFFATEYTGHYVRVIRTSASEVEPWLIIVDYVSFDKGILKDVFIAAEDGNILVDSKSRRVTDLLLDNNKYDTIYKMYHGFLFTRVPHLFIPSQPISLLVNCWIATNERTFKILWKCKVELKLQKVIKNLELSFELMNRVKNIISYDHHIIDMYNNILQNTEFEKYLTNSYEIHSLNRILAVLTLDITRSLFQSGDKYHRFCFAMMSECTMRVCRAKLKASKLTADQLILRLFDLSVNTDLDSYKFDKNKMNRAIHITSSLFSQTLTNCSPFALVSTLGLLQYYHQGLSIEEIGKLYHNETISMKNFLVDHLHTEKSKITQIALYLQGMKYNHSSVRKNLIFENPISIKELILSEYIDFIRMLQTSKDKNNSRNSDRLVRRLFEAQPYVQYHTMPKIFTEEEVDKLNSNICITKEEKFILMENGLLRHHCCYPDCPSYLNCFINEKDKINNTRHGLYSHLKYNTFLNYYVPNLHMNSLKYGNNSYDRFKVLMDMTYKDDPRYTQLGDVRLDDILRNTWNIYHVNNSIN